MRPGQRFKYQRSAAYSSKPITSVGKAYTARAFSMSKLVGEDDLLANEFATTPIVFIESRRDLDEDIFLNVDTVPEEGSYSTTFARSWVHEDAKESLQQLITKSVTKRN